MVQKEVAKKTRTYGLVGLLLAALLVATIYTCGTVPLASVAPDVNPSINGMATFASYEELATFLNSSANTYRGDVYGLDSQLASVPTNAPTATEKGSQDYSTTNIQVAGVDEADTVKTDGEYLYVIGNNSQVIYILDANPQNARVLAKIWLNNSYLSGLYLSADGSKLVVLGSQYQSGVYGYTIPANSEAFLMPWYQSSNNFVYIYNIQNKAAPTLERNFTMSGSYVNSRLIGNYLYNIVSETAYVVDGVPVMPTIFTGQGAENIAATCIFYANSTGGSYYSYTTITAMDITNNAAAPTNLTILMSSGTIYVSQNNIYITHPVTKYETLQPTEAPSKDENSTIRISSMIAMRPIWQGTTIYRVQISGTDLVFAAVGNVTGSVMNQYSMDEHNSYFRIATTSYEYDSDTWSWSGTQQNNVYVLNSNLDVVGKLENLATGESMHAARFMGDRCYLVTFLQVDPLFVIDLSSSTNPKVLGSLSIPGYSDFLQPYDETHLIGIGQDVNASIDADKVHQDDAIYYTAVLGLKVSLFDVSDVTNPQEISKVVIGDRGTSSSATSDPKAILFDLNRNLLVLPVDLYVLANTSLVVRGDTGIVPPKVDSTPSVAPTPAITWFEQYPQFVWQGAYIFKVSVSGGIEIQGNVSQLDNADALLANPSLAVQSSYQWINYGQFITRSLYIGNTLYTLSDTAVQLNNLSDFSLIAKVQLQ